MPKTYSVNPGVIEIGWATARKCGELGERCRFLTNSTLFGDPWCNLYYSGFEDYDSEYPDRLERCKKDQIEPDEEDEDTADV